MEQGKTAMLTVAELAQHLLSLPNQGALVAQYLPNGEFKILTLDDFQEIEAQSDGTTVASSVEVSEPNTPLQYKLLVVNGNDIDGVSVDDLFSDDSIDQEIEPVQLALDGMAEFVNVLNPVLGDYRIDNVHGLQAFNKMKTATIDALATASNGLSQMAEVVRYDRQLTMESMQQKEQLKKLSLQDVQGMVDGGNVIALSPGTENSAS